MSWNRKGVAPIIIAFVSAVVITGVYDRLLFTKFHNSVPHSIAAKALNPVNELVLNHLDADCYLHPNSNCYLETLVVNVFLYTLGIAVVLFLVDVFLEIARRPSA